MTTPKQNIHAYHGYEVNILVLENKLIPQQVVLGIEIEKTPVNTKIPIQA